eukprot:2955470-Rhodomonas_salina.1
MQTGTLPARASTFPYSSTSRSTNGTHNGPQSRQNNRFLCTSTNRDTGKKERKKKKKRKRSGGGGPDLKLDPDTGHFSAGNSPTPLFVRRNWHHTASSVPDSA